MYRIVSENNETLGYYDNIYGKLYTNNYEIITSDIDQEEGIVASNDGCKNIIITLGSNPEYRCTNSKLDSGNFKFDIDRTSNFIDNLEKYVKKHTEIKYIDLYTTTLFNWITLIDILQSRFKNYVIRIYTNTVRDLTLFQVSHLCFWDNIEIHTGFMFTEYESKIINHCPHKFWVTIDISPKGYIPHSIYSDFDVLYNKLKDVYSSDNQELEPIIEYIDYTQSLEEDRNITLRNTIKDFCINHNGLNKCDMFGRIANRLFSPKIDIQDCSTNHCLLYQVKPLVCTINGDIVRCPNCSCNTKFMNDLSNNVGVFSEDTQYRKLSENHWVSNRDELKYIDKCLDCEVKAFCNFCDIDNSEQMDDICCNKTKVIYGGVLDAIISMQFGDINFKLIEA